MYVLLEGAQLLLQDARTALGELQGWRGNGGGRGRTVRGRGVGGEEGWRRRA